MSHNTTCNSLGLFAPLTLNSNNRKELNKESHILRYTWNDGALPG